jgi:hypothetical protein
VEQPFAHAQLSLIGVSLPRFTVIVLTEVGRRILEPRASSIVARANRYSSEHSGRAFGDMTDTSSLHGFGSRAADGEECPQADRLRQGSFGAISKTSGSLRLAAQDVALSRRKQGFESPRERHDFNDLADRVPAVSSWCLVCHRWPDVFSPRYAVLSFGTHARAHFVAECRGIDSRWPAKSGRLARGLRYGDDCRDLRLTERTGHGSQSRSVLFPRATDAPEHAAQ